MLKESIKKHNDDTVKISEHREKLFKMRSKKNKEDVLAIEYHDIIVNNYKKANKIK